MQKIKLPRKRKKAMIKAIGKADYLGCIILSKILFDCGKKHANRFYKYKKDVNTYKPVIIGRY